MATINTAYEDLLRHVLANGTEKSDRTGTGTLSVFGHQMRFDLQQGFPLITTKKMALRWTVEELLWFLSGSTSEYDLSQRGVRWWKEWARDDGELGPTYGKQMRHRSSVAPVKPAIYEPAPTNTPLEPLVRKGSVRDLNARTTYGVGYYGDYDEGDPHYEMLVQTWRAMIRRCYDASFRPYRAYGGAGVHVSERWQCFANFQRDARRIPNWVMKVEYPDEFSLDKDTRRASNRYDISTAMWASKNVQDANRSNTWPFTATRPDGEKILCPSIGRLAREEGMSSSAIHRCLNGQLKSHHGWSGFAYLDAPEGHVLRYNEVDQLKQLIAGLKHDPDSRRHIVSLWNPEEEAFMELPPCHGNMIQFYVADGRLSCQMYQRSGDLFLGVPVNIASYALLTHMVAQQVGLEVGEFVWTGGDCHLYLNHLDQAREQLSRDVRPFPRLELTQAPDLFSYRWEDVTVVGYDPHPAIKAPVAV